MLTALRFLISCLAAHPLHWVVHAVGAVTTAWITSSRHHLDQQVKHLLGLLGGSNALLDPAKMVGDAVRRMETAVVSRAHEGTAHRLLEGIDAFAARMAAVKEARARAAEVSGPANDELDALCDHMHTFAYEARQVLSYTPTAPEVPSSASAPSAVEQVSSVAEGLQPTHEGG